jgi:hypothetical protein
MLHLHPFIQGALFLTAWLVVALTLWIAFARWGSRRSDRQRPERG